jgi:MFS family permease
MLSETEINSGLKNVLWDGIAGQILVTLTSGVFLVAFALELGASNMVIGLLAAIPPLMQFLQIPSIYLVEKIRNRRMITVITAIVARSSWLFIAAIPLVLSVKTGLAIFLTLFLLTAALNAVTSNSWNSWMRDLIPQERLGAFFSKRMTWATAVGIPLGLLAGYFIDYWTLTFPAQELVVYSILFSVGCLAGLGGIIFIHRTSEPEMLPAEGEMNFFKLLLEPFKNTNFRNLILFFGSWSFAVNLAAPFFTVYLLQLLQMEMSYVIGLSIISQITSLLFFRIWGKFSDRYSNKSILQVSGPLFMLCILGWTFTTMPERHVLTMPLLVVIHIFMGISTSGMALASGNIGLKLAPKGQATTYLATNSLVNSLAAGLAPILGGKLVDSFKGKELSMTLKWINLGQETSIPTFNIRQWDFFFVIAFLIGTYSIHRLSLVKEEGEVSEKIIISELFSEVIRPLRNISTAGGLRSMILFPFSLIKNMKSFVFHIERH